MVFVTGDSQVLNTLRTSQESNARDGADFSQIVTLISMTRVVHQIVRLRWFCVVQNASPPSSRVPAHNSTSKV